MGPPPAPTRRTGMHRLGMLTSVWATPLCCRVATAGARLRRDAADRLQGQTLPRLCSLTALGTPDEFTQPCRRAIKPQPVPALQVYFSSTTRQSTTGPMVKLLFTPLTLGIRRDPWIANGVSSYFVGPFCSRLITVQKLALSLLSLPGFGIGCEKTRSVKRHPKCLSVANFKTGCDR